MRTRLYFQEEEVGTNKSKTVDQLAKESEEERKTVSPRQCVKGLQDSDKSATEETLEEKPLICPACGWAVESLTELEHHVCHSVTVKLEETSATDDNAASSSEDGSLWRCTEGDMTHNDKYFCWECQIDFDTRQLYNEHTCTNPESIECDVCSQSFQTSAELADHVAEGSICRASRPSTGEILRKWLEKPKFTVKQEEQPKLVPVKQESKPLKKYYCELCNKPLVGKVALDKHMKAEHAKVFNCDLCGKSFRTPRRIREHRILHQGKAPCTICGKVYAGRARLRDHMTKHTGDRPFECTICNNKFPYASSLVKHMKIHNQQNQILCKVCGKNFTFSSNYLRHMDTEHGGPENNVVCHFCGDLVHKRHIKPHLMKHGEATFSCDVCKKKFHLREQLRRHRYKVHKDEVPCLKCNICNVAYGTALRLQKHLKAKHSISSTATGSDGSLVC